MNKEDRSSPGARLVLGILATLFLGVLGTIAWLWWLWAETPEPVRVAIGERKRRIVIAVASVALLAPTAGLVVTVFSVKHSFDAVGGEGVDPSQKARLLAEGISSAMNATAVGIGLMIPGVIALLVVGFRLARAIHRAEAV